MTVDTLPTLAARMRTYRCLMYELYGLQAVVTYELVVVDLSSEGVFVVAATLLGACEVLVRQELASQEATCRNEVHHQWLLCRRKRTLRQVLRRTGKWAPCNKTDLELLKTRKELRLHASGQHVIDTLMQSL